MTFGEPQSQPERDSKKDSQLLASVVFSPAHSQRFKPTHFTKLFTQAKS